MKTLLVVLVLALVAPRGSDAQRAGVSIPRASAQVAAGTLAIPVGFFAGVGVGVLASGGSVGREGAAAGLLVGIVGGAAGAVAGPAIAVRTVGTGGAPHGSGMAAAGGAIAGYTADLFIDQLIIPKIPHPTNSGVLNASIVLTNFVIPALGATLAYDRSRR